MKKIIIALALCILMVGVMAVPAMAASKSVGAVKTDICLSDGTVVGFAVFNTNAAGEADGLNVQVVVKGLSEGTYELRVQAPTGGPAEYIGGLKVNKQGNGAAHAQVLDLVYDGGAETILCRVNIRDANGIIARTAITDVPLK